jgi:tetratricopeptide (TPR) repeat protein
MAPVFLALAVDAAGLAGVQAPPQAAPAAFSQETDQAASLLAAGRPEEALAHARRAARIDPGNPLADLLIGYGLLATEKPEEAIAAFTRVLSTHPTSVEARGGVAMAWGILGDPRAEKEFAAVLAAAPRDRRYHRQFAAYLWLAGETDRGNREMERAIQLAPSDPILRLDYGKQLHQQGRFLDAAKQLARARDAGAQDPSLLYLLGSAELENAHFPEAERWLTEAIASSPSRTDARQLLGMLFLLTGRPEDARRQLSKAAGIEPDSAAIQLDLGRAAEAQGDLAAAEGAYRRALNVAPDLFRVHYLLGALLSRRRLSEEARQEMALFDKAYREDQARLQREGSLRAENNLGWAQLRKGHAVEALSQFERHPDDVEALRGAAAALSRLGRHAEAAGRLERALLLSPEDRKLRYEIGREQHPEGQR